MLSQRHGGLTTHQPTPSTAPPPNARPPRPFASPAAAPRPVITSAAAIAAAAAPHPSRSPRHARNVATPSSSAAADLPHGGPPPARGLGASLDAAWKFVRPHTIRGTLLGTTALVARALLDNPAAIDWALLPRAIAGLAALLCGNGYIVGINQIYDVDIDAVNKPFLPIAAGTMSPAAGWAYCAVFALLGTALAAFNFDRLIAGLYAFGLFLGTIYSVPPLRLKRFAVPAFLIIATVRGVLLNFGVFYATRAALGLPFAFEPAAAFITAFVTLFATSIAITKDLADVEGDIQCGIRTFATAWGVARVAALGSALLLVNYVAAVVLGVRYPGDFRAPVMIGGHAVLAAALLWRHHVLHKAEYTKAAVQGYYRAIWYLFYSEYLLFPFI